MDQGKGGNARLYGDGGEELSLRNLAAKLVLRVFESGHSFVQAVDDGRLHTK